MISRHRLDLKGAFIAKSRRNENSAVCRKEGAEMRKIGKAAYHMHLFPCIGHRISLSGRPLLPAVETEVNRLGWVEG